MLTGTTGKMETWHTVAYVLLSTIYTLHYTQHTPVLNLHFFSVRTKKQQAREIHCLRLSGNVPSTVDMWTLSSPPTKWLGSMGGWPEAYGSSSSCNERLLWDVWSDIVCWRLTKLVLLFFRPPKLIVLPLHALLLFNQLLSLLLRFNQRPAMLLH